MNSTEVIKGVGKAIDYIKKIEKENKELKKENKELKEENMIIKKLSVKRDDENKKLEEENEVQDLYVEDKKQINIKSHIRINTHLFVKKWGWGKLKR